jgi:endonuclease/exonuclease/phosphatase family metal-dependent hydrolase
MTLHYTRNHDESTSNKNSFSRLRIATLNLNSSPIDSTERVNNLVYWLEEVKPDVFLFQEIAEKTTEHWISSIKEVFPYVYVPGPEISGSGIASKFAFQDVGIIHLPIANEKLPSSRAAWASFDTPNGHLTHVVSAHFAWGPQNEYIRAQQFYSVEEWAEKKVGDSSLHATPKVILGGDFNAEPDNYCIRWLRGEEYSPETKTSTRWTDCWDKAQEKESLDGITSTPKNKYAQETAKGYAQIPYPQFLPERRIDYIFVRGYAYGSQGTPLKAGIWGTEQSPNLQLVSDHYGVWADLLDLPPHI